MASAAASGAPAEIKIGLSTPVPENLPLWMAKDKGFDRANGLTFTRSTFEGGSRGLEALLGEGNCYSRTQGADSSLRSE